MLNNFIDLLIILQIKKIIKVILRKNKLYAKITVTIELFLI